MKVEKLFLAWKHPKLHSWIPVATLEYKDSKYYFHYTNGAKVEGFMPFGNMTELTETYVSDELFPLFKNRLLSKSRPEYSDFLEWLDISKEENSDLLELARSRGVRVTDDLQLFPLPTKNEDGNYEVMFFSHGISHIAKTYVERLKTLNVNERLLVLKDVQNDIDDKALALRTESDPAELMGYCPAFFVKDFNKLMDMNGNKNVHVTIQKINRTAPLQMKLLCKLTTSWPSDFVAFEHDTFKKYQ